MALIYTTLVLVMLHLEYTRVCTTSGEDQRAPSGVQQIGALVRASV